MRIFVWTVFAATLVGCGAEEEGPSAAPSATTVPAPDNGEGSLQYAQVVHLVTEEFQGHTVRWWVPPAPVGMVFLFHARPGGLTFVDNIETIAVTNELIVENFGIVATTSTARDHTGWDLDHLTPADNPDLERMLALHDDLIDRTALTKRTPIFSLGFSMGATFGGVFGAAALDEGRNFRASAPHGATGHAHKLDAPMIFVHMENDSRAEGIPEMAARHADDGWPTAIHLVEERTLTLEDFTKHPGVTDDQAQKAFDEAARLGLIDPQGERLVAADEMVDALEAYVRLADVGSPNGRADDIGVVWAEHYMVGDFAREVRDWFLDTL